MENNSPIQPSTLPPFVPPPVQPIMPEPPKSHTQTFFLILVTLIVGIAVPVTVLVVKQGADIRGRASEPSIAPTPLFKPSTSPVLGICSQKCTTHADCIPGFFCSDKKICMNALCPQKIDCVCK